MKNVTRNLTTAAAQMDANKARMIVFVVSLVMFVIAAGAPEAGIGIIR
jgi:hypothetical protein